MEQPNWLLVIFRHHDDGLDSLQGVDHIPSFNPEKTCEIHDRYGFRNGDDGFEDSGEVATMRSTLKHLSIKRIEAGMTLQSGSKLSVRKVTSVIDEIGKCEGENKRPRRILNKCMKIRLRRPWNGYVSHKPTFLLVYGGETGSKECVKVNVCIKVLQTQAVRYIMCWRRCKYFPDVFLNSA